VPQAAAVRALLSDLGAQLQRAPALLGASPEARGSRLSTGSAELDRLTGGGVPVGRLCEITGPPSSGRTSVAHGLLVAATRAEHVVAWIDGAQAFDAESADAAGVALERVLWVRPPGEKEAIRCCERLLRTPGFALVGLDLAHHASEALPAATWQRLARTAAGSQTALVLLSSTRSAGGFADLVLALANGGTRFAGPPALLESFEIEVEVVRQRSGMHRAGSVRLRSTRAA
jgi:hypothetical protein